jgi:hypothetical protein
MMTAPTDSRRLTMTVLENKTNRSVLQRVINEPGVEAKCIAANQRRSLRQLEEARLIVYQGPHGWHPTNEGEKALDDYYAPKGSPS